MSQPKAQAPTTLQNRLTALSMSPSAFASALRKLSRDDYDRDDELEEQDDLYDFFGSKPPRNAGSREAVDEKDKPGRSHYRISLIGAGEAACWGR